MKALTRKFLLALLLAVSPVVFAATFGAEKIVTTDGTMVGQFPEIAFHNNVVHVVWVGYIGGNQGDIYYARSTSNGSTFSAPVNLSLNATPSSGNDRPQVTAGPNGVYVGWNSNNDTGAIYVKRSTDDGQTFGGVMLLGGAEGGFYSRITDLFTDSAGRVHLAWYDSGDTANVGMIHHRMTCNGSGWGPDTAVTTTAVHGDVDNEQPRLGEAQGRMYVIFRTTRNGNPQGGWAPSSIYMHSGFVDVGTCTVPWSYPARRIAGGFPLSKGTTYRPEIFGEASGMLHVMWWDTAEGANIYYRKGNLVNGALGASSKISNFGTDHLEPGGLSSTPGLAAGGFQAPPGLLSNGTTAFMTYQRQSGLSAQNFELGPIFLRQSDDNGTTWGAEQAIALASSATTPRVALGGTGNQNVYITWADLRGGTARIYFRLYTLGALSGGSAFALTPDTFNFGNVEVSTQPTTVLTLQNSGTAGTINGILFSGADFTQASTTCGGTLGAGASCAITVRFTPSALGTRTGSVTVSTDAVDSPSVTQLTGAGVRNNTSFDANVNAVITGYYESILGRSPDPGGVPFWNGEANRVVGLGADVREVFYALSIQFYNSVEYQNRARTNDQYLTDLYRTFFLRDPDAGGMQYWRDHLNAGMDRGSLLGNFLFSPEFVNFMNGVFGASSPRAEVNMTVDMYRGILSRLPDSGGFNFWLGKIRTAQCQGAGAVSTEVSNMALQFFYSAEYGNIEAARVPAQRIPRHVGDLYNAFLRRGPELSGYQYWIDQINTGARTRDDVRNNFVSSPEFQARVNAVIAQGCMP